MFYVEHHEKRRLLSNGPLGSSEKGGGFEGGIIFFPEKRPARSFTSDLSGSG